jgi:aspartyl-tRNA(Asn)/glutamyl-tRNA(Gln) amidotransferase subunit B
MTDWEVVIGLEIHAQLATKSKIFSGSATAYGAPPNTQASLVDLAYPGVLPVLNAEAVRMAVKFGLSIGAVVARRSVFARKNYFYPDLPKGYQISQYELPVVKQGKLAVMLDDGRVMIIGVTRAHLEEDAGKSLHEGLAHATGIDLNRAGTPLLEIVSEPDMRSAKEAVAYMKKIHTLVRYLEICDGNMQEGSFRCDANVSVRPRGREKFGTRAEIKNLNSFRFVEKAINYEVARQIELLESGGTVVQETRLYDSDKDETRSMRSKEEANDYRYFPDPDLLPVQIDEAFIDAVRATLPELPDEKAARFARDWGLSAYDAGVLSASRELGAYFEGVAAQLGATHASHGGPGMATQGLREAGTAERNATHASHGGPGMATQGLREAGTAERNATHASHGGPGTAQRNAANAKLAANWVMGELSSALNRDNIDITVSRVAPAQLSGLLARIVDQTISGKIAKEVFEAMWSEGKSADAIIEAKGLKQITDSGAIEGVIDAVIAANPKQLADYRSGKDKLFGFFVGQVMKATEGKANPAQLNELLKLKLGGGAQDA